MIVLSSDTAVKEVLDKRSGNYSDRPDMFIGQKVASGDLRLVVMRYGDNWRMIHRMVHNILNIKAAVTYVPYQDLENKILLKDLLETPSDFLQHIRRFTYSLSTQMIYGYRCTDNHDPKLLQLFEPCFCNDIYRAQTKEGFSDDAAAYISGSLLEAGSDTTAGTLYGFIQAILVWPEVQKKAQEEIDCVIGSARLPTIDDYQDLPYIRCCIKESLRWMPTVFLGVPHAAVKDNVYMGYNIPKGATIINNVWAIHMDEERSPNPRVFDPERFKDDHTTLYQSAMGDTKKRDNFVFGAGRRLCQGIHIAERSLFLGMSRLLWAFDFSPAVDAQGNPVKYDIENLVGGITVQPSDYPARIEPRSAEKVAIIKDAAEECKQLLNPVTMQWKQVPEGMAFSTWMPDSNYENFDNI
ncbi:hypothetical protein CaCOL14_008201 [Colletotrichum acutatum]